jgi:CheY-like chemotaxis protein
MGSPGTESAAGNNARSLKGIRVLVVEDTADVREMIATVLGAAGAEVMTVASAAEAMDTIRAHPPDVLLCDLHMPGLDGFELIHRVRSWEKMLSPSSRRIRAAAVSAYAALGQRLRHARDEFQAFLSKPVDPQDLVRTVRNLYDQADEGR